MEKHNFLLKFEKLKEELIPIPDFEFELETNQLKESLKSNLIQFNQKINQALGMKSSTKMRKKCLQSYEKLKEKRQKVREQKGTKEKKGSNCSFFYLRKPINDGSHQKATLKSSLIQGHSKKVSQRCQDAPLASFLAFFSLSVVFS